MLRFKCASCDEWHEGMPSFAADAPLFYYSISEEKRAARCELTSDTCVIDDRYFYIRGCLDIVVEGVDELFSWGVWVSLSQSSFNEYIDHFDTARRDHLGPYFGWLATSLPPYPETENLKTRVHPRNDGTRPYIELEPTDHPLAVEQREGIDLPRLSEIYAACTH